MKLNLISLAFLAILSLSACQEKQKSTKNENRMEQESQKSEKNDEIVGKKARLVYPEFEAEVSYISKTRLHWKTTDANGNVAEADEEASIQRINNSKFFVNWIEEDGYTVSQVIDVKEGTIIAYLSSHAEESSRGQRSADFTEGKWIEIE